MERWKLNLYTLWVTQIFSLMGFGLCIPFAPYFLQELGLTDPVRLNYFVGLSYTLPAATMAVAAPIWGVLSDRYGRKVMILRSMGCAAVLLTLMGLCDAVWQFLALRCIQGILTGTVTASMTFVSANTPADKQSYAIGLMTSSNFLGYSAGPFLGGLVADLCGYRICFYVGAVLMTIGATLVLFLVKEDKSAFSHRLPDKKEKSARRGSLFTPFVIAVLFALLSQRIARTVFSPYIALFVQENMGTITGAATYTGFINGAVGLATAVAALTLARLGDHCDRMHMVLAMTALSVPVAVFLPLSPTLLHFAIALTGFSLLAGAIEPVLTSAVAAKIPPEMRGSLFGVLGTVSSIGGMISPMIGASISVQFSLRAVLISIPLFTLSQLICLIVSSRIGHGKPKTK